MVSVKYGILKTTTQQQENKMASFREILETKGLKVEVNNMMAGGDAAKVVSFEVSKTSPREERLAIVEKAVDAAKYEFNIPKENVIKMGDIASITNAPEELMKALQEALQQQKQQPQPQI